MATFEQQVADNIRSLQRQINEIATARLGDVTLGPGEGSLSTKSASGNLTFQAAPDGARAWYRGALAPLTGTLEAKADTTYVDEKDGSLSSQINANDAASRQRDTAESEAREAAVSSLSSQINANDQKRADGDANLSSRINTNDANSRSRDDALSGRVTTAQSRADSAYSLAEGRATQAQIQSLSSRINANDAASRKRDTAIETAIQSLAARVAELERRMNLYHPPQQA